MDIYVGNLAFQFSESDLTELFQEFGEIKSVKLISDKVTGKSKGFGFVTMDDDTAAQAAIDKLNGSPIGGRNIVVNQARPKTENAGGGGYSGGNRGGGNRYGGGSGGGRNHGGGGYGNRDRGGNDQRGGREEQY